MGEGRPEAGRVQLCTGMVSYKITVQVYFHMSIYIVIPTITAVHEHTVSFMHGFMKEIAPRKALNLNVRHELIMTSESLRIFS